MEWAAEGVADVDVDAGVAPGAAPAGGEAAVVAKAADAALPAESSKP
ncbi:MAG: hypothetical protein GY838_19720 [bacterium]|nr:hypothetical protein [bacterium]